MGKYIVIYPDKGAELRESEGEGGPGLDLMQSCVGGFIEHVWPVSIPEGTDMFCNEEGKLNHLPYNLMASALYGNPLDCIVGTVIILAHDDMGESLWLSDEQAEEIMLRILAIESRMRDDDPDDLEEDGEDAGEEG